MRTRLATALLLLAALTLPTAVVTKAPAAPGASAAGQSSAPDQCALLARLTLPGKVKITSAERVAPSAPGTVRNGMGVLVPSALPAYCKVEGMIDERTGAGGKTYGIGFALALPDDWSGRFLVQGGGGLNGSVGLPIGAAAAGDVPALARGFAVMSHDSGHRGQVFDPSFMADQRANLDFSESAVRTVTELGKALTARYYGKPINHSYMAGCSTGGRESMLASQRYPELFDGIVVGAPAMRTGDSNLAIAYSQVQFNQAAPRNAHGVPIVERIFSAADRKLILGGLLAQCDGLDGLKDGMIENVAACHFKPVALQCKGRKTDQCLSAAQVGAMERAFAGPRDKAGYPLYTPVPYDTGIVTADSFIPGYLPTGRPGPIGPASRDLAIDLDKRMNAIRMDAGQRLTDTYTWTNLNTFTDRGGKIVFYHGVSDPWFSALATLDYWLRAEKANGAAWADASRFYLVPGMGHCGGGNAFDNFDLLSAVVDWVEQGRAPGPVTASRATPLPAARPLCPYPTYAHYKGGTPEKAESFECRGPLE